VLCSICCFSPTAFYILHHIQELASLEREREKAEATRLGRLACGVCVTVKHTLKNERGSSARKSRLHCFIPHHNDSCCFSHTFHLHRRRTDGRCSAVVISPPPPSLPRYPSVNRHSGVHRLRRGGGEEKVDFTRRDNTNKHVSMHLSDMVKQNECIRLW